MHYILMIKKLATQEFESGAATPQQSALSQRFVDTARHSSRDRHANACSFKATAFSKRFSAHLGSLA